MRQAESKYVQIDERASGEKTEDSKEDGEVVAVEEKKLEVDEEESKREDGEASASQPDQPTLLAQKLLQNKSSQSATITQLKSETEKPKASPDEKSPVTSVALDLPGGLDDADVGLEDEKEDEDDDCDEEEDAPTTDFEEVKL